MRETYKNFSVKKTRNGLGLFSKKIFKPFEFMFEVKGKKLTCDEDDEMDEEIRANCFRFDQDYFVDSSKNIGWWVNHSCKPNSRVDKKNGKLYIIAVEKISKNKEILIDYSTILAKDDVWQMKCNCGEKNCRKVVKQFDKLNKKLKKEYISSGIVPKYILEIK